MKTETKPTPSQRLRHLTAHAGALFVAAAVGAALGFQGAKGTNVGPATVVATAETANPGTVGSLVIQLTADDVLGWRASIEDLLDKDVAVLKERFGEPNTQKDSTWEYAETPTQREMNVGVYEGKTKYIMMIPRSTEVLDVRNALQHADLFEFQSGVYRNTTTRYLALTKKDDRTLIQFAIQGRGLRLEKVGFLVKEDQ